MISKSSLRPLLSLFVAMVWTVLNSRTTNGAEPYQARTFTVFALVSMTKTPRSASRAA